MENFSFNRPINLSEEAKWLLTVTSFEATDSVFNITNKNNSFLTIILVCWRISNYLEDNFIDKLKSLLKLIFQKDIELHVAQITKTGNKEKMEIRNKNQQFLILLKEKT